MDKINRGERAAELFTQGYNCCQSVALAYADLFAAKAGLDAEGVKALASGFGGGIARQREICGCVSGMTMVLGAAFPADPSDQSSRTRNYALVQQACAAFREAQGSIICRDLLGLRQTATAESPVPSERTPAYYHSRKCADFVACAAEILETILKENL